MRPLDSRFPRHSALYISHRKLAILSAMLRTSMTLLLPLDRVFAFFADAANPERITQGDLPLQIGIPQPIFIQGVRSSLSPDLPTHTPRLTV